MTEQRKLIRLGNSSFALALPTAWVDKSGLKKGDKVFLESNSSGGIVISSDLKKLGGDKKIEINTDGLDEYTLEKEMTSAYVKGYKEFHFTGKSHQSMKKKIDEIKTNLLSLEFLENGKDKLVIRDFLNFEEINIDNFIRRIDNNLREAFDLLAKRLAIGNITKNELEDIRKIDEDINKAYMLISRILIMGLDNPSVLSSLKLEGQELFNKWWYSFNLEHIGDSLKNIAKVMGTPSAESNHNLLNFFGEIYELYIGSMDSFYKQDRKMALSSMKESKMLFDKHRKEEYTSATHSKIAENMKYLEDSCYQNLKMTTYMRA